MCIYDKDHMSALQIKNASERDPCTSLILCILSVFSWILSKMFFSFCKSFCTWITVYCSYYFSSVNICRYFIFIPNYIVWVLDTVNLLVISSILYLFFCNVDFNSYIFEYCIPCNIQIKKGVHFFFPVSVVVVCLFFVILGCLWEKWSCGIGSCHCKNLSSVLSEVQG